MQMEYVETAHLLDGFAKKIGCCKDIKMPLTGINRDAKAYSRSASHPFDGWQRLIHLCSIHVSLPYSVSSAAFILFMHASTVLLWVAALIRSNPLPSGPKM